jgi:subtilisin family serine protease
MRKKTYVIMGILLFSMIPTIIPVIVSFPTLIGTGTIREQLYSGLDDELIESAGLPEAIPFWVDMVDGELVTSDGEGVYIAVLDTGLLEIWPWLFEGANIRDDLGKGFTHDVYWDPVLEDIVWGPLRDDRGIITKAFEGSGHGTHVTSTIVGYNYGGLYWIRGVAPKATIIPVLVLDAWWVDTPYGPYLDAGGTDEMVSAGIYYAADLSETLDGPLIISMSLGGPDPSPMIEDAVDYAIDKGVIVVASAGNSGEDGMGWPGAYPQVISCAMGGWTEQWVDYPNRWWLYDVDEELNSEDYWGNNWQIFLDYGSSRPNKDLGQKAQDLDVTAPGCAIVGPYKRYFDDYIGYYYLWGTSMAAPHVSSIAAMVLQDHGGYDQSKMEKTLKNAAHGMPLPCDGSLAYDVPYAPYYFTWDGTDYGAGFLQADAALKSAK